MLSEHYLTRLKTDKTSTFLVKTYQSNLLPIVIGDKVSFNHGIANFSPLADRFLLQAFLKCVGTDLGYNSPDVIIADQGISIGIDDTAIVVFFDSRGVDVISNDNQNRSKSINPNSWRLFLNLIIF